jgi:hypothetical protein
LETSNAQLRAALIVTGREIRKLNFGWHNSPDCDNSDDRKLLQTLSTPAGTGVERFAFRNQAFDINESSAAVNLRLKCADKSKQVSTERGLGNAPADYH